MPSLDATLTWALPVHVAQLGAHVEAYLETLPALNALRACNRFIKGPQCSINKLPVKLVQSIAHYYILPIRAAKLKQWKERLECYEGDCELIGHWDRADLVENYWEHNSPLGYASPTPEIRLAAKNWTTSAMKPVTCQMRFIGRAGKTGRLG